MSFYTRIRNHNGKPTGKKKRKSVEWFWGYQKKKVSFLRIFFSQSKKSRMKVYVTHVFPVPGQERENVSYIFYFFAYLSISDNLKDDML